MDIVLGGNGKQKVSLDSSMTNRHGVITGATGTGKTVTLQVLAESFSRLGVPVFTADVKGDLSGIAGAGKAHPKITERLDYIGIDDHQFGESPVRFWDIWGKSGHPIRATISSFGPTLLASLLQLNDTQAGILHIAFSIADDEGLLLLDLKDLRSMLNWVADNAKDIARDYGRVSRQSVDAILRKLLVLDEAGGDQFFGEPALDIQDLLARNDAGQGIINLLDATQLLQSPRIYTTFLLWLLSELMENLPERGDAELPELVFFFDEAHLLFDTAPPALLETISQVTRLIRSKGVGIFFVSQYPNDIPDDVLGQLGCRIQHALRAFTPKDKKAVKVAAKSFRENPDFDTAEVISNLGVGEALISTLDKKGIPTVVQKTLMSPPASQFGPITKTRRKAIHNDSPLSAVYDQMIDRESAFEILREKELAAIARAEEELAMEEATGNKTTTRRKKSSGRRRQSTVEKLVKSVARTVGSSLGRQILRGILGSISRR